MYLSPPTVGWARNVAFFGEKKNTRRVIVGGKHEEIDPSEDLDADRIIQGYS